MATFGLEVIQRWPSFSSKPWLEAFLQGMVKESSISVIVVLGSGIRARGHKRSDLDLLVLYRGMRPKISAPIEIDIRQYRLEEAERLIAGGHEVVGWAMKFGFVLYDPDLVWQTLSQSWMDRVPLPHADIAVARGEKLMALGKEMLHSGDEIAASEYLLNALTQFVRMELIKNGIYPASRPELPEQLSKVSPGNPIAHLLENVLYQETSPYELLTQITSLMDKSVTSNRE